MNGIFRYSILLIIIASCKQEKQWLIESNNVSNEYIEVTKEVETGTDYKKLFIDNSEYISKKFDFPVGKPNAKDYYNAQKFQENNHLGDDWNGVRGGNSDLGDSIFSISNGYISEVKNYGGGWGNVVRIVHFYNEELYESLYAHCDTIIAKEKTFVKKGEQISTIGNCNGIYYAHLHLELRDKVGLGIGNGYSTETKGYLNPTNFIKKNR